MTVHAKPSGVTVRGGLVNVPHSTTPTVPVRHQPIGQPNKKFTKPKTDYIPHVPEKDPDTADAPPTEPVAADPSESPTEGETDNDSTTTSKSD